jgi:hypothetical protein
VNVVARLIGYALGGRAGERLAQRIGLPISNDTLLRCVKKGAQPAIANIFCDRIIVRPETHAAGQAAAMRDDTRSRNRRPRAPAMVVERGRCSGSVEVCLERGEERRNAPETEGA